ncbi:ABC transporter permease [Pillotina sp. SPG140]|jgi:ABC-type nitrate/sulfonate/bicarbonate transport system permease component
MIALIGLWTVLSMSGLVPAYMLPSPMLVIRAFIRDFPLLMQHLRRTLSEAGIGLGIALAVATALALAMDALPLLKRALMPLLVVTQTIPTIALAPLLVLWLGYGSAPKITLVFLSCFFPLTLALVGGFAVSDAEFLRLFRVMGAKRRHIYWYLKIPWVLPSFFSGLRVSSSYAIIGAVVAEWLGGNEGLGVYMTRVRRSYSFDKMFACLTLVVVLSVALMKGVGALEKIILKRYQTYREDT